MRRATLIALIWLAALAGGLALAPRLASVSVTDPLEFFPRESRTRRADAALAERFPAARAPSQIVVVIESESGAQEVFPREQDRIRALAERFRTELPSDALTAVLAPTDDPVLADRLVAADGRAALVVLRLSLGFASERASAVVAQTEQIVAAELAPGSGLRASLSGEAPLGRDYLAAIEEGGRRSGLATIALVAITLLAVYRAPVAALVSLVTLGAALGVTFGAVTLAAQLGLPVAYQSRGFLVALLFGIGTDYCLLLFARVRESARESETPDPVGAALRHTAPVIAISAGAVAVACALMALARFGLFRDSGPALAISAAVALAAILTLTPELMRLARTALFWPSSRSTTRPTRSIWTAIAERVVRSPAAVLLVFATPLAPLVWSGLRLEPSFEVELDIPDASASERGWQALTRHFDPAAVSPLVAAIALPDAPDGLRSLRAVDGLDALYQISRTLAAEPGVGAVWSATQPTGDPALLARATLASQLDELRLGLGHASEGARALASGLGGAEGQVGAGRADLAAKREQLAAERKSSLLGALAPGRFDAAARDLEVTGEQLGTLETGLGRAARGASQLADGVALGAARLDALHAEPGAARVLDHLALTASDVRAAPDLARALDHYVTRDGRAALFELRLEDPPNSPAAVALYDRLRERIPIWLAGFGLPDATVWLAGATAITAELSELTRADQGRLGIWILLGVFALLVALLRGIVAPLCVSAFILASYFAALGALQLLVDLGVWPGVDWKVPFFLFVLLVAIGADYGVFVLGRAREEARALPWDAAIARALEATGPVVTSCGVVLAGTFATLLLARIAFLEQVGIGVTIGVLIDTLIVRPFLLPAAALLLARPAALRA